MYRRPPIDMCLEFCEANGIEPKAHCLNYMTPGEFPKWWKKSDVKHEKELLEKRFRILAERYAERIPMWEVTNETWQPNVFGSFLRRDMSPKPSYNVICDLFGREWRTNFDRDAPGGRLSFRGFCGTYEVEATSNGRTVKRQFHVGHENPAPVCVTI